MNEEKEQTTQSEAATAPVDTGDSAVISLGEKEFTIYRLKAGKFYTIFGIYTEMVKDITPPGKEAGKEEEVSWGALLGGMFQKWPSKMMEFINVSASSNPDNKDLTSEFIKENAYPEQITEAFAACFKLNRVADNLKNFGAPMMVLAEGSAEKK